VSWATGTRITAKSVVEDNATQTFLVEKILHFVTFYIKADKPVKWLHAPTLENLAHSKERNVFSVLHLRLLICSGSESKGSEFMLCKSCETCIPEEKRFQHEGYSDRVNQVAVRIKLNAASQRQTLRGTGIGTFWKQCCFHDLCEIIVAANTRQNKLNSKHCQASLKKCNVPK
jgi:hypothetical protein